MSPGQDLSLIPAEKLAASSLMPPHLRDDPVSTLVMVNTLQSLGLPVNFMTLGETYVVSGRPGLMSKLQRTMAARAGWRIEPIEVSAERAVVRIMKGGKGTLVSFTMAEANRANLPKRNPTYAQWPDRMLFARACTKAIALVCPEVLFDPDLPDLADRDEWRAITGSDGPALPLGSDEPVPADVYDDEPEASQSEEESLSYERLDPTRPFLDND